MRAFGITQTAVHCATFRQLDCSAPFVRVGVAGPTTTRMNINYTFKAMHYVDRPGFAALMSRSAESHQ